MSTERKLFRLIETIDLSSSNDTAPPATGGDQVAAKRQRLDSDNDAQHDDEFAKFIALDLEVQAIAKAKPKSLHEQRMQAIRQCTAAASFHYVIDVYEATTDECAEEHLLRHKQYVHAVQHTVACDGETLTWLVDAACLSNRSMRN
jgi:hypothetical protein